MDFSRVLWTALLALAVTFTALPGVLLAQAPRVVLMTATPPPPNLPVTFALLDPHLTPLDTVRFQMTFPESIQPETMIPENFTVMGSAAEGATVRLSGSGAVWVAEITPGDPDADGTLALVILPHGVTSLSGATFNRAYSSSEQRWNYEIDNTPAQIREIFQSSHIPSFSRQVDLFVQMVEPIKAVPTVYSLNFTGTLAAAATGHLLAYEELEQGFVTRIHLADSSTSGTIGFTIEAEVTDLAGNTGLLVGTSPLATVQPDPVNLLINGGFEEASSGSLPVGWHLEGDTAAMVAEHVVGASDAFEGTSYLRFDLTGNEEVSFGRLIADSTNAPLKPNTTYQLSFHYRSTFELAGPFPIYREWRNPIPGNPHFEPNEFLLFSFTHQFWPMPNVWMEERGTFTTGSPGAAAISDRSLSFQIGGRGKVVEIDGVVLAEVSSNPPQIDIPQNPASLALDYGNGVTIVFHSISQPYFRHTLQRVEAKPPDWDDLQATPFNHYWEIVDLPRDFSASIRLTMTPEELLAAGISSLHLIQVYQQAEDGAPWLPVASTLAQDGTTLETIPVSHFSR